VTTGKISDKRINEIKWKRMRCILDKLKKGPLNPNEISNLLFTKKTTKTDARTIQNYMKELIALGLVNRDENLGVYALDKVVFQSRHDYDIALEHSKLIVATPEELKNQAECQFNGCGLDGYSSLQIQKLLLKDEKIPVTLYGEYDGYFLQHIKTGYPDITTLIKRYYELKNQQPRNQKVQGDSQDICDLLVGKVVRIIDGVNHGTPLFGQ
jgi:hypothetical protein